VLYEMLTGRKAFQGKSQVSLIGAILKNNPARSISPSCRNFDITPDGQRFLMLEELPRPASARTSPTSINVVLNWTEELKQRVAK
jgi:hypothetical protein